MAEAVARCRNLRGRKGEEVSRRKGDIEQWSGGVMELMSLGVKVLKC